MPFRPGETVLVRMEFRQTEGARARRGAVGLDVPADSQVC